MKIVTVVGARPQFIKVAVLSRALRDHGGFEERIVHTGQHYDAAMSSVFFDEMGIPAPGHHLGIGGLGHGAMTGRQIEAIETALIAEKPDAVMVVGDTNSTLAGALAAVKLRIPVAHVEAGLRSFNRAMPEEINRIATDHIATWAYAPSATAMAHLAAEGIGAPKAVLTGDVMFDAALAFGPAASRLNDLDRLGLASGRYSVCTVHRQENTDDLTRLTAIFEALRALAVDGPMVLPMHPRTRKVLEATGAFAAMTRGLTIVEPVGFVAMIALLRGARLVVTDSGSVQREAYFHDRPVVVIRDETEWPELEAGGWARLVPPVTASAIVDAARAMDGRRGDAGPGLYGDGTASRAIAAHLASTF